MKSGNIVDGHIKVQIELNYQPIENRWLQFD